ITQRNRADKLMILILFFTASSFQLSRHFCTSPFLTFKRELPAVKLHDFLTQGQSQTCAALFSGPALIHPVKGFCQMFPGVSGNSRPVVFHAKPASRI